MSLTKTGLIESLIENVRMKGQKKPRQQFLFSELNYTSLSRERATVLMNACLDIMKKTLEKGELVRISGFGTFRVRSKGARKGRNFRTGEEIMIQPRRVVTFHASRNLKDKINLCQ